MRWLPFAALVLAQVCYPLVAGHNRATLAGITVVLGFSTSVGHAVATRGARFGAVLVAVTAVGGLGVESLGVATGFPFGAYGYGDELGPRLLGVPLLIGLAWTWMAWPAWLVAGQLAAGLPARVALAGVALAAWDLFLDPQMVKEGYWRWTGGAPTLPGVNAVPTSNYLGWLAAAAMMMAALATLAGRRALPVSRRADAPMLALYLWTYVSSLLAHAAFLDLPASALWGGLGMGLVAVPLMGRLGKPRPRAPESALAKASR